MIESIVAEEQPGNGSVPAPAGGSVDQVYRDRCDRFARLRDSNSGRWSRIADLRLLVFLLALIAAVWGIVAQARLLGALAVLLFAGFALLARYHGRLQRVRRRYELLARINDAALHRVQRRWDMLQQRHPKSAERGHAYADDLDIFGRGSLLQLLDPGLTPVGLDTLRRWLLAPAPLETIAERQPAVTELAPALDFRQELLLRRRLMGSSGNLGPFLEWAEGDRWLSGRTALLWAARISVLLLWLAALAQVAGLVANPLWLAPLLLNLLLAQTLGREASHRLGKIYLREGAFRRYGELLALVSSTAFVAPALRQIQGDLLHDSAPAHEALRRLQRLTSLIVPPSALAHSLVQALTLWDLHLLAALEEWQAAAGRRVRGWLSALAEMEALTALAGLAHDNPDWALPKIDPAAEKLVSRNLGHPLLAADVRVVNDLEIGPAGSFLLVTGSNMSGKSTLLRAIGLNLVLAGAGGPVCASAFCCPP
ncbi:MAG: hypothetical protein ACR2PL_18625, partial [Dehalococcoidia bacterium]